jgi:hypothetical protein
VNVVSFLSGLITLPALGAVLFACSWAFSKSNRSSEACEYCTASGCRTRTFDFYERRRLTVWLDDTWHEHVTARRLAHRQAWQAKYDAYLPGGNMQEFYAESQKTFGIVH